MEYLALNNGVRMPLAGFGTWTLRGETGKRCILDALETGYRLLDTAQMYENEDIVGLARATGMTMEELAQYLMHIKKGGSPFCSTPKEDMKNAPEEN